MAAIIDTRSRLAGPAPRPGRRPDLRLVPGGRSSAPVGSPPLVSPAAVVAFVVVALVLAVGAVALGRGALSGLAPSGPAATASAATPSAASAGERTVTVGAGDTLWSIARRLRPTGDVRPLVDQLAAANGGSVIHAGDRLVVPS